MNRRTIRPCSRDSRAARLDPSPVRPPPAEETPPNASPWTYRRRDARSRSRRRVDTSHRTEDGDLDGYARKLAAKEGRKRGSSKAAETAISRTVRMRGSLALIRPMQPRKRTVGALAAAQGHESAHVPPTGPTPATGQRGERASRRDATASRAVAMRTRPSAAVRSASEGSGIAESDRGVMDEVLLARFPARRRVVPAQKEGPQAFGQARGEIGRGAARAASAYVAGRQFLEEGLGILGQEASQETIRASRGDMLFLRRT